MTAREKVDEFSRRLLDPKNHREILAHLVELFRWTAYVEGGVRMFLDEQGRADVDALRDLRRTVQDALGIGGDPAEIGDWLEGENEES